MGKTRERARARSHAGAAENRAPIARLRFFAVSLSVAARVSCVVHTRQLSPTIPRLSRRETVQRPKPAYRRRCISLRFLLPDYCRARARALVAQYLTPISVYSAKRPGRFIPRDTIRRRDGNGAGGGQRGTDADKRGAACGDCRENGCAGLLCRLRRARTTRDPCCCRLAESAFFLRAVTTTNDAAAAAAAAAFELSDASMRFLSRKRRRHAARYEAARFHLSRLISRDPLACAMTVVSLSLELVESICIKAVALKSIL